MILKLGLQKISFNQKLKAPLYQLNGVLIFKVKNKS